MYDVLYAVLTKGKIMVWMEPIETHPLLQGTPAERALATLLRKNGWTFETHTARAYTRNTVPFVGIVAHGCVATFRAHRSTFVLVTFTSRRSGKAIALGVSGPVGITQARFGQIVTEQKVHVR